MNAKVLSEIVAHVRTFGSRVGRRYWIWAILGAGLALALDFVPLFDLLGYDFSFAVGLLTAVASVDIGHGVVAAARRTRRPTHLPGLLVTATSRATALLAIPLLLSLANMMRVRNCNWLAGVQFFLLLPFATALFASGAGVLAGLAFPRRGRLVAFLLPVLSIVWTLWRLYIDPPVFAYDPFGGYFPGPIYDEALRPPATLLWFRMANLLWLAAAVALALAVETPNDEAPPRLSARGFSWHRQGRRGWLKIASTVGIVIAALGVWMSRGSLGFHVREADLIRVLDGQRQSAHVDLRYATSAGLKASDVAQTMEDIEFRYDQLRDTFHAEPNGRITIFQFPSAEEKKIWVGAGGTLYAKPWMRQIFLQGDGYPSRRLRHEMAHVFAGAFGDRLFGVAFAWKWKGPIPIPRLASGLIEGIAETADFTDPDGGSTTHQEAAAILADNRASPLSQLMGAGFSAVSGPRAYTLAGSFVRYLFETRGADRLREIYRSAGDFEAVYGTDLGALETEWRKFLGKQSLSAEQRARAREHFRRPAIFKKVCAREQAARVSEARGLMTIAPARALRLLEQSCNDDPDEPTIRIDWAQAMSANGQTQTALSTLSELARNANLTSPVRARAATVAAGLHFHAGDFDNARIAVRDVLAAASDEGERRMATSKLRALEDEPARRTLGRALWGDDLNGNLDPVLTFFLLTEFSRLHPSEALGPYLVGRQLAFRDPKLALSSLRVACDTTPSAPGTATLQTPLAPDFRRECLRLSMWAALKAGDLARARAAAQTLRAESTEDAERLRVGDFLERVTWIQAKQ